MPVTGLGFRGLGLGTASRHSQVPKGVTQVFLSCTFKSVPLKGFPQYGPNIARIAANVVC